MSLSILIPTVPGRAVEFFTPLYCELVSQLSAHSGFDWEILVNCDPKIKSVGEKRNALMSAASKTHLLFMDDDDLPHPHYVSDMVGALTSDPDCIGCVIDHTIDGVPAHQCVHSPRFKRWSNGPVDTPGFGMVYQRGATHRNVIRTTIARQVRFPELHFGEDRVWSEKVTRLCRPDKEFFIERPGFIYRYSTKEEHREKYGIK